MGRSRTSWGDKDQISSGEGKRKGKRGYGREAQNEGYFCKIPIIQQDTNFISQTFSISQTFGKTNFYSPPLQSACPKTCKQRLSSDFKQLPLVKNNLLTSVHNNADAADDYNRVIDMALLKLSPVLKMLLGRKGGQIKVCVGPRHFCFMSQAIKPNAGVEGYQNIIPNLNGEGRRPD